MIEGIVLVVGSFALAFVAALLAFVVLMFRSKERDLPEFGMSVLRALSVAGVVFGIGVAGLLVAVF